MPDTLRTRKRISILISLIIAGEAVFFLPFVLARIFRPTLLEVFEITNTELGTYFSIYGIVAMVSYIFGGTLADRFSARNLMAIALWLTSLGGFIMAWLPSSTIMRVLYGFWGFTTIFLFWAAMIKATREWGGSDFQGRAFGWLEGGRGGTAAILGTISFLLFSWFSVKTSSGDIAGNGIHAFQIVILTISGITFISGILIWYLVPKTATDSRSKPIFVVERKKTQYIYMDLNIQHILYWDPIYNTHHQLLNNEYKFFNRTNSRIQSENQKLSSVEHRSYPYRHSYRDTISDILAPGTRTVFQQTIL